MTCGLSGKGIQLLNPGWKSFFVIPGFMPYGLIASGIFLQARMVCIGQIYFSYCPNAYRN